MNEEKKNDPKAVAGGCLTMFILGTIIWMIIPDCSGEEIVERPVQVVYSNTDLKRMLYNYEQDFQEVLRVRKNSVFKSEGLAEVGTSILYHDVFFEKLLKKSSSPEEVELQKRFKLSYNDLALMMLWYDETIGQGNDSTRHYTKEIGSKIRNTKKELDTK